MLSESTQAENLLGKSRKILHIKKKPQRQTITTEHIMTKKSRTGTMFFVHTFPYPLLMNNVLINQTQNSPYKHHITCKVMCICNLPEVTHLNIP